jgi:hypothetical protein
MRIGRSSWLPLFLVGASPLALAGSAGAESPVLAAETGGLSQARALDLARQAAALEGYDPAAYVVASVEQASDGTWVVFLDHVPPGAPGRHCTVYVSPDGSTRLVHGR